MIDPISGRISQKVWAVIDRELGTVYRAYRTKEAAVAQMKKIKRLDSKFAKKLLKIGRMIIISDDKNSFAS